MEKDDKFYAALSIAAHLCEFIEGGNLDLYGQVRQFVFGVSESVVTVRAFFDQSILAELDARSDALYQTVRKAGATTLTVKVFHAGAKHTRSYTPKEKSSSETEDEAASCGVLLRVERARKGDDFLRDRDAFREAVGASVRALLSRESSHPNVFFNGESCDFF